MSHVYTISAEGVKEMLRGGGEFLPAERLLRGVTEEQANIVPPGSPYSLAQVVAHLHFWQQQQIAQARGEKPPRPEHLDDTFAPPPAGAWDPLVADFLAGISEVGRLADEKAAQTSPDRDDTDIAYDLAESALHNAYHLGQVALLRQCLGLWPPEGGDGSW